MRFFTKHTLYLLVTIILFCGVISDSVKANQGVEPLVPGKKGPESLNVDYIGDFSGMSTAVEVQGNFAYLGVGLRMNILDISDPTSPILLGRSDLVPEIIEDIDVVGDYAYIADGYGGFHIIDVSQPTSPVLVGSFDDFDNSYYSGIDVVGDYAYLADGWYGLIIFDVSSPSSPVLIGIFQIQFGTINVRVVDSYAYLTAGYNGLLIVNVSQPDNPVEVGSFVSGGYTMGVDVAGNYAYLAETYDDFYTGFHIIDVSVPESPIEVGYLFSNSGRDLVVSGTYAFIGDSHYLRVVDVNQPNNPILVSTYSIDTADLVINANRVYISWYESGLSILDVSSLPPVLVGNYDTSMYVNDMDVSGSFVYIAAGDEGLQIVDISQPEFHIVGSSPTYDAVGVTLAGQYAYIADYSYGIRIIDVSQPDNPVEVGSIDTPGRARAVEVLGYYAYVADGSSGLRIIDISIPSAPTEVGFYDTPGNSQGLSIDGNYAYVADNDAGLRIINISQPSQPVEVGFYDTPTYALSVAVNGNYAYVANYSSGLYILDISLPSVPVEVSHYDTPAYAADVMVDDQFAYVADYIYPPDDNGGLLVFDVRNPANIALVGFSDPMRPRHLILDNGFIYLAEIADGLAILRFNEYDISGRILDVNSIPLEGVSIVATSQYNAVSDSQGYYTISGVLSGTYTLTPSLSGYYFTPPTREISVPPDATGQDFIGDILDFTISGRIMDTDGNPLSGVYVSNGNGYSAFSDSQGYYTVTDVLTGTYTFTPTLSGYTFTPPNRAVSVPPDATGQDFTGEMLISKISGQITDQGGTPLPGVSVSAGGGYNTVTDGQGDYVITDVIPGTYTIIPTMANYSFTPPSREVNLPPDATGQDFAGELLLRKTFLPVIVCQTPWQGE